jgi:hypothetical protein
MPRREGLRWASLGYLEWADQNKMRTCLRHGAEDFLLPGRNSTFVTRRVGRGNSTGVCVVCVGTQLVCVLCVWGGSDDNVAPATTRGQGAHEVRFRRDRFSPTGDLVYSGISGAVGLGHRCTV